MPPSGTQVLARASAPNIFQARARDVIAANAVIKAAEPSGTGTAREFIRLVKGHPRWATAAEGLLEVARPGALEEFARICWECAEGDRAKVAEAESLAEAARQQLNAAQKAYLTEIASLRDEISSRVSVNLDNTAIYESYEPLRYMDDVTKDLVLLVVKEQVKVHLSRQAASPKNAERNLQSLQEQLAEEKKQNEELEEKLRVVAEKCNDMDFAGSILRQQVTSATKSLEAMQQSHNNLEVQLTSARKEYEFLSRKMSHVSKENDQLAQDKFKLLSQLEERVQGMEPEPPPSPHLPSDSAADTGDKKDADADKVQTMLAILKDDLRRKDERIRDLQDENDAMQAILQSSERLCMDLRGEVSKAKNFSAANTQNSWHITPPNQDMSESFAASFYGSHSDLVNSVEQTMQRTWQKITSDMQEQLTVTETKLHRAERERYYAEQRYDVEKQFKEEAEGLVHVLEKEIHELEATFREQRQRASSGDDWCDDWPPPSGAPAPRRPSEPKAASSGSFKELLLCDASKQPWPPRSTSPLVANSGVTESADKRIGSAVLGPRSEENSVQGARASRGGLGTATMPSRGDLGTASQSELGSGGLGDFSNGLSDLRSPPSFGMGLDMGSRGGPSRGMLSRGSNLHMSIPQTASSMTIPSASGIGLTPTFAGAPSSPQRMKEMSIDATPTFAGAPSVDKQADLGCDWAGDSAPSAPAPRLKREPSSSSLPSSAAKQQKSRLPSSSSWSEKEREMLALNYEMSEKVKTLTADNEKLEGSNHRLRLLLDELTARFQRMRDAAETKGQTKMTFLAEIAETAGLGEVFQAPPRNVFERLYTDALLRLQRLEKVSQRIHEEEKMLLLGTVDASDLGDSLSARLQRQTRQVLQPEVQEPPEVKSTEPLVNPNGVALIESPGAGGTDFQQGCLQGKAAPFMKAPNRTDGFQHDADKGLGGQYDAFGRRKTQPNFFPAKFENEGGANPSPPPPMPTSLVPPNGRIQGGAPAHHLDRATWENHRHSTGRFTNVRVAAHASPPVLISGMRRSFSDMHQQQAATVPKAETHVPSGSLSVGDGNTAEVVARAKTFTELPRLGPKAFLGGYLTQNRGHRQRGR